MVQQRRYQDGPSARPESHERPIDSCFVRGLRFSAATAEIFKIAERTAHGNVRSSVPHPMRQAPFRSDQRSSRCGSLMPTSSARAIGRRAIDPTHRPLGSPIKPLLFRLNPVPLDALRSCASNGTVGDYERSFLQPGRPSDGRRLSGAASYGCCCSAEGSDATNDLPGCSTLSSALKLIRSDAPQCRASDGTIFALLK